MRKTNPYPANKLPGHSNFTRPITFHTTRKHTTEIKERVFITCSFWHIYHFRATSFMRAGYKFNLCILIGQYMCYIKHKDNYQVSTT